MENVSLTRVFCDVDDFLAVFPSAMEKHLLQVPDTKQRKRATALSVSEVVTILVMFHISGYRTFKHYYLEVVQINWRSAFPGVLSYTRFLELVPRTLIPLSAYLKSRFGHCTGIGFIDSTKLQVCHNKRISRNKVFRGLAKIGKTTMGWFFGFKLHLVINDSGELLAVAVTPGNIDDRVPVPNLTRDLIGKVFGDKGYISPALFEKLFSKGLQLITNIRSNMKNHLLPLWDKILLRKRSLIETVNDQLKNISQVDHSRHRSAINFGVNLLAGLVAYTFQPKKPSLKFDLSGLGLRDNQLIAL